MDNKKRKNINKNRNIIWFNPPFCKFSNINIGKYFQGLISKHFKYDNPLRKISDRNNVKISYSCTNNISKIIDNHSEKLINKLNWNNNGNLRHSGNYKIKMNAHLVINVTLIILYIKPTFQLKKMIIMIRHT